MADPVLELIHVSKSFGDTLAIDDLSFSISRGEVVGFLGSNGAGKTTTLRMILNIIKADSGEIRLFGKSRDLASLLLVGYLPEERGLYSNARPGEIISHFGMLKGMNQKVAHERATALLRQFELQDRSRSRIGELSKGTQQKIGLMVTIAHDPEMLILDEPFSGLDPINQEALERLIRQEVQRGKTILFSTHTMAQAERLADRILILAKGRLRFDGTMAEVRDYLPRHVRIEADTDLKFLEECKGVASVTPPLAERTCWTIELQKGADGRTVLAACLERGVVPYRFDIAEAALHDVFIALNKSKDAPG